MNRGTGRSLNLDVKNGEQGSPAIPGSRLPSLAKQFRDEIGTEQRRVCAILESDTQYKFQGA